MKPSCREAQPNGCGYRTQRLLVVFGLILLAATSQAQSSRGREFYLGFVENGLAADTRLLELSISIASGYHAHGTVEVTSIGFKTTFSCAPNAPAKILFPSDPFSITVECLQPGKVLKGLAVHVTSDSDISVSAESHHYASTDSYLALPVTSVGGDYYALCYAPSEIDGVRYPQEALLVSNQDSTEVDISLSCRTIDRKPVSQPLHLLLNRGDVYMLQSDTTTLMADLTGTHITSNKPIEVLSGNSLATIPPSDSIRKIVWSGDHVVEEIPPTDTWGTTTLVAPYASSEQPDAVRILSAADGTSVNINGIAVATLNADEYYDLPALTGAAYISASAPILVGQFMHSSSADHYGDPSFSLVLSPDQFDTSYAIMSFADTAFHRHFVNIVAPNDGVGGVILDGSLVSPSQFAPFPACNYSYAQIEVQKGGHVISSAKPIGVTVYGFGIWDSYAQPGGSLAKRYRTASAAFGGFDSILRCESEDRTVWIENTSDFAARINSISVTGPNSSTFHALASVPTTILPGDSAAVTVRFQPGIEGSFTATLQVSIDSPRHQTMLVPLSAVGFALSASFDVPHAVHLSAGERCFMPIYASSDLGPLQADGYGLKLAYDPSLLTLTDVMSANTISANSFCTFYGASGSDSIVVQLSGSLLPGGAADTLPLLYLIFHSPAARGSNPVTASTPVHYSIGFHGSQVGDACIQKQFLPGVVIFDSLCASPSLMPASGIPEGFSIAPAYPNPSTSTISLLFDIPSPDATVRRDMSSDRSVVPVTLDLFNSDGILVANVVCTPLQPGEYTVTFDCTHLADGDYLAVLRSGSHQAMRKIAISR